MRVVVTGATGNVGSALLRHLRGRYEVTAVSRRPPPAVAPFREVSWAQVDLAGKNAAADLAPVLAGADAVVHLAWQLQPGYPSYERDVMRRKNVDGTDAVARAVVAAGVPHLVHMSSVGAYAPAQQPGARVDETFPATGVATSTYSQDKAAAEALLDTYDDRVAIARVRPTLVLQPAAASEIARYFLGPVLGSAPVRKAIGTPTLRLLPWPRELSLQFVHADDVAAAIDLLLDRQATGAYNVAAEPVLDREAYRTLVGGVGPALSPAVLRGAATAAYRLRLQPTEPGWLDLALQLPLLDTTRLRQLGWSPGHDGAETFLRFLTALREGAGGPGALLAAKEHR